MIKTVIKQLVITILLTLGLSQAAVAAELEGVKLPGTARVVEGGADLVLNGAGVRTRFDYADPFSGSTSKNLVEPFVGLAIDYAITPAIRSSCTRRLVTSVCSSSSISGCTL